MSERKGAMNEPRPHEQQTALEKTLRAYLWTPTDRLERATAALAGHIKRKEYRAAADCQETIRKAQHEIDQWTHLLELYEDALKVVEKV